LQTVSLISIPRLLEGRRVEQRNLSITDTSTGNKANTKMKTLHQNVAIPLALHTKNKKKASTYSLRPSLVNSFIVILKED